MPGVKFTPRVAAISKPADGELLPLASNKSEGLLPSDSSWIDKWNNMPVFETGDVEIDQKIVVHFRCKEDVRRFADLLGDDISVKGIGSRITESTNSIWFGKDEDYIAAKELLYKSENLCIPRYPIYIISKGRWETSWTARALEAINVPHHVVVEPSEADNYEKNLGKERLIITPEDFSKHGQGSIPVRNFVWDHAVASGKSKHWILDDNIRGFLRLNRNRRIPVSDGAIFCASEDFTDRYENIALSGFNYMYFANPLHMGSNYPPFNLNTRIYSMILVNHELQHRWRGRYNEDTDLSLRALKDGWCTILFNSFLGDKQTTLTMKGGNTDTIYNTGDERREFAESLQRQHPDVVTVVRRYNRWHYEVNYRPFARNRLIPRDPPPPPPEDPEYGMRLVRDERRTRYPEPPAHPITPITFAPKPKPKEP